jgi:molecular chaperone GrpE
MKRHRPDPEMVAAEATDPGPEATAPVQPLATGSGAAARAAEQTSEPMAEPGAAVVEPIAAELDAARRELAAAQERFLRLAADYANYRNRTERGREVELRRERAQVLRGLLELGDNLERALQSASADLDSLRKGVELTQQQWMAALRKLGVDVIEAAGKPFDPVQHEALAMVQAEGVESGHVVEVVQPGYVMQGEVLRPARVNVAI